ncbi:membrane protein [Actinokineospora inagensis]|uniref:membrane protein n=1 Tax=Actinokineospora inagensis TaxID=103730 RepID=UPI0004172A01|nr:membrane protein [Actinokineospora inagensis]
MSATDMTSAAVGAVAEREPAVEAARQRRFGPWPVLWALAPALVYLGVREVGLLALSWMAGRNGTSATDALRSWDGQWFLSIAANGYGGVPANLVDAFGRRSAETPLAFFPGYPTLVGWVHDLGFRLMPSALAVTIAFGVLCAYGLARLGKSIGGGSRAAGLLLVALFAGAPMGIVLSMAYSEAVFCALAVWALVFVLERRWIEAGLACAFAGLVRPTAAALVLTIGLAALVAIIKRRDGWRPWVGALLAPLGLLGYLAWVGARTGSWDGWFALQERGWASGFDGGAATVKFSLDVLADARSVLEVATVGLIVVALVLFGVAAKQRMACPLLVYTAGVLVMDLCSNGLMNSKVRLMVPAFALLIPVALALAKRKRSTATLTVAAVVLTGSWFGAYAVTAWGYAI